ncbi:phosphomethylpyrimidine kinase [Renibacterium salmoninarum ATCC 33209]|uniref:Phosphomethylpyrimidine kinase n=1 Tax=Renibacterium salmoninarum (strain ATCC 33209 / DSM 20767 / JCM 11484 / NBRC 15589 / NCIMB 2235) TaxID=288705 RepID=A9WUU6_RENSM|nr:bifunctional hydroxymethylpyrimidine kinase/phosphomethylpyrimidine kinase [Renibacterium salmoninarum]ABY24967.1 phosphomethylpyrimidine kinase [Renibacterium salmoninarum ATCC 33209]
MLPLTPNHLLLEPVPTKQVPRVLTIAGSDPAGGAGIQADLKSIGANGGYGMAVIAALTAQNTRGVRAVHVPPIEFLVSQLEAISEDITVDAVKIGMLADAAVIGAVSAWLRKAQPPLVVLDPVMIASSGARLLDPAAEIALRGLLHQADLITPNLPEMGALLGKPEPKDWATAVQMAFDLAAAYDTKVLLKGGHFTDEIVKDALISVGEAPVVFEARRIETNNTHGTGCSLSAAIATRQALVGNWHESLRGATTWLHGAIRRGSELNVGNGYGPVHHFHQWQTASVTESWWQEIEPIRAGILALPLIKDLRSGELAESDFAYYLAQDALYLKEYSRALARASALAPTEGE